MIESARRYELAPGETCWPTASLFLGAAAAQMTAVRLGSTGALPPPAAILVCALAAYAQFTVMHDAVHRCTSRRRWLNEALGHLSGLALACPFEGFRRNHLRHHAHTNDPGKDPDFWVAGASWASTLARCALTLQQHYYCYVFRNTSRDASWKRSWAALGAILLLAFGGVLRGWGKPLLLYWALPAQLAVAALAFLFDYWPHRPHTGRGRLRDTAALASPWLDAPFLAQNLHLVHHLYPAIPWVRYRKLFGELRPSLEKNGAPIWDFRTAVRRLKPGPLRY